MRLRPGDLLACCSRGEPLIPQLCPPDACRTNHRKEDVMVWVVAFEIAVALIIGFVVVRSQSASLVGRIDELK